MCRREEEKSPRQDEGAGVTPDYTASTDKPTIHASESTNNVGELMGGGDRG